MHGMIDFDVVAGEIEFEGVELEQMVANDLHQLLEGGLADVVAE